jgi:hypothetical protein
MYSVQDLMLDESVSPYDAYECHVFACGHFRYSLEHLSRICRILSMPCGSGLLVGVGGSGRQSLTKLASAIQGNTFFQPEISKSYGMYITINIL